MLNKYTSEKNIKILISLLKKNNIKNIIASPGTTNISFVASVQSDSFFNVISCVDERSACYMACGIAAETNEPVVITCTGATASRNYIPGLTEAYYRKLPILAITATQYIGRVGQNIPQILDRSVQLKDMVVKSVILPEVNTEEDEWLCNYNVNDAILSLKDYGGGPVHINMVSTYSNDFSSNTLPDERVIKRYFDGDDFPKINKSNVAIFVGNHLIVGDELTNEIEKFCEKYNGVVLCDHTSNYNGKYKVMGSLVCAQSGATEFKNIDLLIDIGNISGAYIEFNPKEVWRINDDGVLRDTYKKLTNVFAMSELEFFKKYNNEAKSISNETTYYEKWKKYYDELLNRISLEDLPLSNLWIASKMVNKIPRNSSVHLAILNTLRSWNFFECNNNIKFFCNTGGFGIDGIVSTALGSSLINEKITYCFVGDLAFFYDMNSIGNKNLPKNLRIMLINNGCGTEFHNYNHRAYSISKNNELSPEFFAADGHYGNKSNNLVKHYAEDLGFKYFCATNKEEFLQYIEEFTSEKCNAPMLFEIFTNSDDESEALKKMRNIDVNMKGVAKRILGDKGINVIKSILKK